MEFQKADFFARQDAARRHTSRLIFYFILAVIGTIASCYVIAALAIPGSTRGLRWDTDLFVVVATVISLIVCIGCWAKFLELGRGGSAVAVMLGGRPINPSTSDPAERRVLNVVEEMAIAAGTRVPQVYLLENEAGINAFAAGHTPDDTVIGITAGALKTFNRDELQGVIAHEFSHILNGDMRLNMQLMGWIFGVTCLAHIGYWTLRLFGRIGSGSGGSRQKGADPRFALILIGLGLLIIGSVGALFGNLIRAAVSRQREFLADASAVQFTRNPGGIGGALRKIFSLGAGSKLESPHAAEAGHFLFASGMGSFFSGLLATHPPLNERIAAIENQPFAIPVPESAAAPTAPAPLQEALGISQLAAASAISTDSADPVSENTPPDSGATALGEIPVRLRDASRDSAGACAILFGLLLNPDPELQRREIEQVARLTAPAIPREIERLRPDISALPPALKLPLIDLCLPALRTLSDQQIGRLIQCLDLIMASDGKIDLFEFALQKIVHRHLSAQEGGATPEQVRFSSLLPLQPECELLLSALAHSGADDDATARTAFERGATALSLDTAWNLKPLETCGIARIEQALNRLKLAAPSLKTRLVEACHAVAEADGVVFPAESEMVRAVADTLGCPVPRAMDGGSSG